MNTSGRKFDKASYITNGQRFVFHSQKVDDLDVRAFGDTAIATMTLDDHFTVDGREVKATFKSLCVFTKEGGKWLWSAGQTMWPAT